MKKRNEFSLSKRLYRLKNFLKGNDRYYRYDIRINKIALGSKANQWVICPDNIDKDSVIYLFGAGTDISFDTELVENFGVKVCIFDPTPKSIEFVKAQNTGPLVHLDPTGLADFTGETLFYLPENPDHVSATMDRKRNSQEYVTVKVERLADIMKRYGHQHIDLLKMDIEGAEYSVITDILASGIPIRQLLVEFHHRFPNIGIDKTNDAIRDLRNSGFALFNVSEIGEEFSFINLKFGK
jgi:FkbM family methyltransferase